MFENIRMTIEGLTPSLTEKLCYPYLALVDYFFSCSIFWQWAKLQDFTAASSDLVQLASTPPPFFKKYCPSSKQKTTRLCQKIGRPG
jgi:hypothetical protein